MHGIEYLKKWSQTEKKRCVVGVLHDINQAMRLGSEFLVLRYGEMLAYGKDILTDELLEEAFDINVGAYMRENLERWT
jgi:ABC-type cobalamin/Fe3+-siderophores transport system ATPase subunit